MPVYLFYPLFGTLTSALGRRQYPFRQANKQTCPGEWLGIISTTSTPCQQYYCHQYTVSGGSLGTAKVKD